MCVISTTLCILFVSLAFAKDDPIVLQIQPKTIIETLKALKTSGYLKKLVDEFALKAAEQLMKQIKNDQRSLPNVKKRKNETAKSLSSPTSEELRQNSSLGLVDRHINGKASDKHVKVKTTIKQHKTHDIDDTQSEEFLALMETPSPDGDNLEKESVLTDLEVEKPQNKQSVSLYKVNGRHYRRYDFYWK